ncbi:MAG: hypothetical protein V4677_00075 [Bacteroidota bacterium]
MKVIISIVFFTSFCCFDMNAQSVSSQKKAQVTEPDHSLNTPVQVPTTATLVSGSRNPTVREVPLENESEATLPVNTENVPSARKPK